MRLKEKNIAKIGPHSHIRTNGNTMAALNAGIGNFVRFNINGIGRTIFHALQATGTFIGNYKRHNNQILIHKGKNKLLGTQRSAMPVKKILRFFRK